MIRFEGRFSAIIFATSVESIFLPTAANFYKYKIHEFIVIFKTFLLTGTICIAELHW